jgi:hypothetical protein
MRQPGVVGIEEGEVFALRDGSTRVAGGGGSSIRLIDARMQSPKPRRISALASVEPSLTTMTSNWLVSRPPLSGSRSNLWARTLVTARPIVAALLKTGITTDTRTIASQRSISIMAAVAVQRPARNRSRCITSFDDHFETAGDVCGGCGNRLVGNQTGPQ